MPSGHSQHLSLRVAQDAIVVSGVGPTSEVQLEFKAERWVVERVFKIDTVFKIDRNSNTDSNVYRIAILKLV